VELAERPLNTDRFSLPRLEMSTFSPWQAPGSPQPSPSRSPPPRLEAAGGGRGQGIADEGRDGIGGDGRRQGRGAGDGPREAAQVFIAERGGVVSRGCACARPSPVAPRRRYSYPRASSASASGCASPLPAAEL
jgi:hypothetical protein